MKRTVMSTTSKTQRLNLRASEGQEKLLRKAAEAENTTVTDFVLGSAITHAERVLADRRWFVTSPQQYDEFVRMLDAPHSSEKLAALFAEETIFDKPFTIDD